LNSDPEPTVFDGRRKIPGCTKLSVKIAGVTIQVKNRCQCELIKKERGLSTQHVEIHLCADDAPGPSSGELDESIDGAGVERRGQSKLRSSLDG
jgi:hypothetical protein